MALKNMLTREIKYTRKTEKSAFREIFVARYIPILQYRYSVVGVSLCPLFPHCLSYLNITIPSKEHTLLACWTVCNRSRYLPGNLKLVWHPAHHVKGGWFVDLSMDTMHLKEPWLLFGAVCSALTLPPFLLSPRIIMLCHSFSTITKDHFW